MPAGFLVGTRNDGNVMTALLAIFHPLRGQFPAFPPSFPLLSPSPTTNDLYSQQNRHGRRRSLLASPFCLHKMRAKQFRIAIPVASHPVRQACVNYRTERAPLIIYIRGGMKSRLLIFAFSFANKRVL